MAASHANTADDMSKQAVALLPEIERFLSDLGSRNVGEAMVKQGNLLSKIRAITAANNLPANQHPANGHVTPPPPISRTASHSSSEAFYDDTDALVTEAGLKTVTSPSVTGHVVVEEEGEIEYEDVTEYQGQGQKKVNTQTSAVTKSPECNVNIVAADKAASGALHSGHLIKKSKSQVKALWTKLTGERRWCVLTKDTLYYYEKSTSKQQVGTIQLTDYQCTPIVSESSKKPEHTFVLTGVNKKTHTFVASSSDDLTTWMEAMNKVCRVTKQVTSSAGSEQTDVDEEENIYDEMPADGPPEPLQGSKVKATALPPDVGRVERIKECNSSASLTTAGNKVMVNGGDDVDCEEEIYDDTISSASPSLSVTVKSSPSLPDTSPALPTRGQAEVKVTQNDPTYPPLPPRRIGLASEEEAWRADPASCLFMVTREWRETKGAELVCKRGQLLQLVSKQHESEGWWAMTDGRVTGLVPCTYVTAAFTSVL